MLQKNLYPHSIWIFCLLNISESENLWGKIIKPHQLWLIMLLSLIADLCFIRHTCSSLVSMETSAMPSAQHAFPACSCAFYDLKNSNMADCWHDCLYYVLPLFSVLKKYLVLHTAAKDPFWSWEIRKKKQICRKAKNSQRSASSRLSTLIRPKSSNSIKHFSPGK